MKYFLALSCALVVASPGLAQNSTASPPVLAPIAPAGQAVLRAGTPVPLRMSEALTTNKKKLRVGQRFRLETAAPITVEGHVVIPAGSPATGEVTDVRNKGMWGKSGRIGARVLFVSANGRQIRMSGQLDDKGTTGTAGVVGSALLLPVAGFFVTGTSANIPLGAPVNGFIDEDVPLSFASSGNVPMVVGGDTAPMGVAAGQPAVVESVPVPIASPTISDKHRQNMADDYRGMIDRGITPANAKKMVEKKYGFPMH